MSILRTLFGLSRALPDIRPGFSAELAPDHPFIAIGDIHGCAALLFRLVGTLDQTHPDTPILCVGDYVDRGEDSAGALATLFHLSRERGERFQCLVGNHEAMLLKFIDEPDEHGERWLLHGGLQTLSSYGVGLPDPKALVPMRDALVAKMGGALIDWLRGLATYSINGNVATTHAGADPRLPIAGQTDRALLWGHPEFETVPRRDDVWVVHGHTIVPEPVVQNGRIAIDTGAYATGTLSAVYIEPGNLQFLRAWN